MFEERLTDFIHFLKFEKRYSPHTVLSYTNDLEQFRDYLATKFDSPELKTITHFHIRGWLAGLKDNNQTPRSLNRKISSLSAFFKQQVRLGHMERNPVRQLHALRVPERLPVFLKEKETQNLLEEVQFDEGFKGATDRLICELLYSTGMRRNELQELKEGDVEWGLKQIRVLGKGNKERLIPVNAVLLDSLRDYIQEKQKLPTFDSEHLLVLETGLQLYPVYIYRVVTRYLGGVTTQKKKSPHILRHTFATHLLNNGANIQAIKDLLGHSSLAATQVYTHNNIDRLKEIHKQNHPRG